MSDREAPEETGFGSKSYGTLLGQHGMRLGRFLSLVPRGYAVWMENMLGASASLFMYFLLNIEFNICCAGPFVAACFFRDPLRSLFARLVGCSGARVAIVAGLNWEKCMTSLLTNGSA